MKRTKDTEKGKKPFDEEFFDIVIKLEPWKKIRSPHLPEKEIKPKKGYTRKEKHKRHWEEELDQ